MDGRHTRLVAAMAAAWEAEVVSARVLAALAERIREPQARSRMIALSAFCRAHAARLLARLSANGRIPLPVPSEEKVLDEDEELSTVLVREAASAKTAAARYGAIADLARQKSDLSSAWVCELNRTEEEDRAVELMKIAQASPLSALPPPRWVPRART